MMASTSSVPLGSCNLHQTENKSSVVFLCSSRKWQTFLQASQKFDFLFSLSLLCKVPCIQILFEAQGEFFSIILNPRFFFQLPIFNRHAWPLNYGWYFSIAHNDLNCQGCFFSQKQVLIFETFSILATKKQNCNIILLRNVCFLKVSCFVNRVYINWYWFTPIVIYTAVIDRSELIIASG